MKSHYINIYDKDFMANFKKILYTRRINVQNKHVLKTFQNSVVAKRIVKMQKTARYQ